MEIKVSTTQNIIVDPLYIAKTLLSTVMTDDDELGYNGNYYFIENTIYHGSYQITDKKEISKEKYEYIDSIIKIVKYLECSRKQ